MSGMRLPTGREMTRPLLVSLWQGPHGMPVAHLAGGEKPRTGSLRGCGTPNAGLQFRYPEAHP